MAKCRLLLACQNEFATPSRAELWAGNPSMSLGEASQPNSYPCKVVYTLRKLSYVLRKAAHALNIAFFA